MAVQDLISSILENQARINFLGGQLNQVNIEMDGLYADLLKAKKDKEAKISDKDNAFRNVDNSKLDVSNAQTRLSDAEINLKKAQDDLAKAQYYLKNVPEPTDDEINVISTNIKVLDNSKNDINKEIDAKSKEIVDIQSSLRGQGFEFNLTAPTKSSNVIL
jgi:chromosome segregation ATPase